MRTCLALAALLTFAPVLEAQQARTPRIAPGDRIRISAESAGSNYTSAAATPGARLSGVVREVGWDFVAYEIDGFPGFVEQRPFVTLDTLDVRHRSRVVGARGGALWGLFLGTSIGVISGPLAAGGLRIDTGVAVAAFGAGGGAIGTLLGAATGAVIRPPKWTRYAFEPEPFREEP